MNIAKINLPTSINSITFGDYCVGYDPVIGTFPTLPICINSIILPSFYQETDEEGNPLPLIGELRDGNYTQTIYEENGNTIYKFFRVENGIRIYKT